MIRPAQKIPGEWSPRSGRGFECDTVALPFQELNGPARGVLLTSEMSGGF